MSVEKEKRLGKHPIVSVVDGARVLIEWSTIQERGDQLPVWKLVNQRKGEGVEDFFGTVSTYIDSDGLKWEHRFERPPDEDELIGFGSNGEEVLIITLESFYPTTVPGVSRVILSPSP